MAVWVRISVSKFERIREALKLKGVTQQIDVPAGYHAGWRLVFKGEPVAFWYAAPMENMVRARIE